MLKNKSGNKRMTLLSVLFVIAASLGLNFSVANAQPYAYVANGGSHNVSVIDTATNTIVATVPIGNDFVAPVEVAITPNGRFAYVANVVGGGGSPGFVSVINTTTKAVVATIPTGDAPQDLVITPDSRYVYISLFFSDTVAVIDALTNTVTRNGQRG